MSNAALRRELEALWAEEMVPVFAALGKCDAAEAYLVSLRERLQNPFLAHRLADIAHGLDDFREVRPALLGQGRPEVG